MFDIAEIKGAKLVFSRPKGLKTASVGIFINAGARYENRHLKGVAHFLEHMVFKGSKKYSYRAIKREIEGRGGLLNGFTSQEVTAYYSQCLSKNVYRNMDILLDMAVFPSLDAKEIKKERNVILEEVKMHNDLPHIRAGILLDRLLWRGHPLGEEVIGYLDTIMNIKREDLSQFRHKFYVPHNMIIVCVADCDKHKLIDYITHKLRKVSSRRAQFKMYPPSPLAKIGVSSEEKEINQAHICMGFRGPSYQSRERFAAELLHIILGANMSSRLFEDIREKRGLCYDVSTEVRKFRDSGAFCIHAGLDVSNIIITLKNIFKQLYAVKTKAVSAVELERAKDYMLGQVTMGMEKPSGKMFYFADSYLALKKIYTQEEIESLVRKISSKDIMMLANRIFNFKKVCISCVSGHLNNIEEKIKDLINSR